MQHRLMSEVDAVIIRFNDHPLFRRTRCLTSPLEMTRLQHKPIRFLSYREGCCLRIHRSIDGDPLINQTYSIYCLDRHFGPLVMERIEGQKVGVCPGREGAIRELLRLSQLPEPIPRGINSVSTVTRPSPHHVFFNLPRHKVTAG